MMMDMGLLYAICAGVAALVDCLVLERLVATKYKETIDKSLRGLLIFFITFSVVDCIWGCHFSTVIDTSIRNYIIFTYMFHLWSALSAFMWAGYMIKYVGFNNKRMLSLNISRSIFFTIQLVILFTNIWTGIFFTFSRDGIYEPHWARNFMFMLQFAYYILLILYGSYMYLKVSDTDRKRIYAVVILFSLVPILFGLGQMIWPDAPMYSLGWMFTAILIYSFNITTEREKYLTLLYERENNRLGSLIEGLSNDYEAIFYVDLKDYSYTNYCNSDYFRGFFAGQDSFGQNFFKDLKLHLEDVEESDREVVKNNLDYDYIIRNLEDKPSYSFSYRINLEDSVRYYTSKVTRIQNDDSKLVIGVFDESDRIKAEMENRHRLQEALNMAESSSRAKSNFLFNVSHDIRTPMNAILGFNELARKYWNDKDYLFECLDKTKVSGEHLLNLINDVLDMSRIESGKMNLTCRSESLGKTMDELAVIIGEMANINSVNFSYKLKDIKDDILVFDKLKLSKILLNILSNAVKYTPAAGYVDFTVSQIPSVQEDACSYEFVVKDTGIGMGEAFLEHIFEEFEREESTTISGIEGTGLGMSIVKYLVDLMGGSIDIKSHKGEGTQVAIVLSFMAGDEAEIEKELEEINIDLLKGLNILLVDDNNLNREIAADVLSDYEFHIDEATDGSEAVEIIKNGPSDKYDLIFMDIQMPVMNGYEAAKAIRALEDEKKASIPIVAMTANAFEEDRQHSKAAGMNAHLTKPINTKEIIRTLSMIFKDRMSEN